MNKSINDEKVYRVLGLISQSPTLSQRELADSTGFSLGMVNLIVKRLIKTGYLKASSLNKRKVEYLLTPKGIMEKTKRTYSYVSQAVRTFIGYEAKLSQLVNELMKEGHRSFMIVGEGEIAALTEMVLKSFGDSVAYRHGTPSDTSQDGETVLDCRLNENAGALGVSVLSKLLGDNQEANPLSQNGKSKKD